MNTQQHSELDTTLAAVTHHAHATTRLLYMVFRLVCDPMRSPYGLAAACHRSLMPAASPRNYVQRLRPFTPRLNCRALSQEARKCRNRRAEDRIYSTVATHQSIDEVLARAERHALEAHLTAAPLGRLAPEKLSHRVIVLRERLISVYGRIGQQRDHLQWRREKEALARRNSSRR